MHSLDTNLVFRLIVLDDEVEQTERAALIWQQVWQQATIAGALWRLVDSVGVTTEHATTVLRALESYERGSADFSDYIILESSRAANALPVLTFDKRFAREPDVQLAAPEQ